MYIHQYTFLILQHIATAYKLVHHVYSKTIIIIPQKKHGFDASANIVCIKCYKIDWPSFWSTELYCSLWTELYYYEIWLMMLKIYILFTIVIIIHSYIHIYNISCEFLLNCWLKTIEFVFYGIYVFLGLKWDSLFHHIFLLLFIFIFCLFSYTICLIIVFKFLLQNSHVCHMTYAICHM